MKESFRKGTREIKEIGQDCMDSCSTDGRREERARKQVKEKEGNWLIRLKTGR